MRGLRAKILWPILGLMGILLVLNTCFFVSGTLLSLQMLLRQRLEQDTERVVRLLLSRAEVVQVAAQNMASRDDLNWALQEKTEASLAFIDSQAVIVRNRFNLDLIQVYDPQGIPWVNLVTAELFRVSSLLDQVKENSVQLVRIDSRLLLLSRATTVSGGTIITGIDLGSELKRVARGENVGDVLGLRWGDVGLTTEAGLSISDLERSDDYFSSQTLVNLAGQEVVLTVGHSATVVNRVIQTGLLIVVLTSVGTTGALIVVMGRLVNSLLRPIQELARVSQQVAEKHDFAAFERYHPRRGLFQIGRQDEVGQLEDSFRWMLEELEGLYWGLEKKVEERTHQIVTAAEIARAIASTLDLNQVLQTAVEQIRTRFGYSFVGIFVLDMQQEQVVLRYASSQEANLPADVMIPLNQRSLITAAVQQREPLIAQEVDRNPLSLPHWALPETRSEAVFPLLYAGTVIGVLDIQSVEPDAFPPEMVETLSTLAVQVATAIQNAIVYQHQRELTSRLAELDHLKMQLLNTINHELRTPLNAIIGFSRLLLKGIDGDLNEAQRSSLSTIYNQGQHLLELVNRIVEISHMEAGRVTLDLRPTDLRQEIMMAVARLQQELDEKPIRLELDLPPDLPVIIADTERVQEVVFQLLSNAVKFTREGVITISATHSPQWVMVSVTDTGIGISPEDMDKLFPPFSQVDLSSARRFGGLGLGLSLARYIVELHGGHIWAESRPGEGSTFSFLLPLDASAPRITALVREFSWVLGKEAR
ncbi:MAG: GAF domain-containing protein [Thermoflexia bacterium]|nr:MAG: GAF domain-containing protein [Thermoflexia bacterium]